MKRLFFLTPFSFLLLSGCSDGSNASGTSDTVHHDSVTVMKDQRTAFQIGIDIDDNLVKNVQNDIKKKADRKIVVEKMSYAGEELSGYIDFTDSVAVLTYHVANDQNASEIECYFHNDSPYVIDERLFVTGAAANTLTLVGEKTTSVDPSDVGKCLKSNIVSFSDNPYFTKASFLNYDQLIVKVMDLRRELTDKGKVQKW